MVFSPSAAGAFGYGGRPEAQVGIGKENAATLCTGIYSLHHVQGHWQCQIRPCMLLHCGGMIGVIEGTPHDFIIGHAI